MKNWKTTLAGTLAAVCAALTTGVLETGDLTDIALTVSLAALGYYAKDRNVTHIDPEKIAAHVANVLRQQLPPK